MDSASDSWFYNVVFRKLSKNLILGLTKKPWTILVLLSTSSRCSLHVLILISCSSWVFFSFELKSASSWTCFWVLYCVWIMIIVIFNWVEVEGNSCNAEASFPAVEQLIQKNQSEINHVDTGDCSSPTVFCFLFSCSNLPIDNIWNLNDPPITTCLALVFFLNLVMEQDLSYAGWWNVVLLIGFMCRKYVNLEHICNSRRSDIYWYISSFVECCLQFICGTHP